VSNSGGGELSSSSCLGRMAAPESGLFPMILLPSDGVEVGRLGSGCADIVVQPSRRLAVNNRT
jgi:hypothetical protein